MPILDAQCGLQAIIFRPSVISSLDHIGIGAIGVATRRNTSSSRSTCGSMGSRKSRLGWICTGCQPGRNEALEPVADQKIQRRIGIGRLELLDGMGAVVAHLGRQMSSDLALHAESPLFGIRIANMGIYGGIGATAGIDARPRLDKPEVGRTYVRAVAARGRQTTNAGRADSSGLCDVRSCIHYRRRAGYVREHVVELRIIGNTEAATNDSFILTKQTLPNTRRPGKAHIRPPVFIVLRNMRNGGQACR